MNIDKNLITEIGIESKDIDMQNRIEKKHKLIFLVAGRLVYRKGHDFLLDALKRVPCDFEYECRVVGDGPKFEALSKRCMDDPVLQQHVQFKGRIPYVDMEREYKEADVFVMPSLRETTGSVLLEAMSKGLPIITINKFGGVLLVNEKTGWVYDGKTKEELLNGLSSAIIECINCPSEVVYRGKAAKEISLNHTWSSKMDYYCDIYRKVLKNG